MKKLRDCVRKRQCSVKLSAIFEAKTQLNNSVVKFKIN